MDFVERVWVKRKLQLAFIIQFIPNVHLQSNLNEAESIC